MAYEFFGILNEHGQKFIARHPDEIVDLSRLRDEMRGFVVG
jgi:hypothetical protein